MADDDKDLVAVVMPDQIKIAVLQEQIKNLKEVAALNAAANEIWNFLHLAALRQMCIM
jgi:hypothetical protein